MTLDKWFQSLATPRFNLRTIQRMYPYYFFTESGLVVVTRRRDIDGYLLRQYQHPLLGYQGF